MPGSRDAQQTFYAGVSKPRELAHDARVHAAYVRAVEKLEGRGARVRRVVLEEELKADYQRFLQRGNRRTARRPRRARAGPGRHRTMGPRARAPVSRRTCRIPDARIEYDDRDGRPGVEDLEVVTPHYRGAHAAAKAASGFSQYRAIGARVGGVSGSWSKRSRRRSAGWPRTCCHDPRRADCRASPNTQGFTARQAGFLVTVMVHSGVCVRATVLRVRADPVHGQKIATSSLPWLLVVAVSRYTAADRPRPYLPRPRHERSTR